MKKLILILCALVLAGCVTTRGTAKWSSDRPMDAQGEASVEWNYTYSIK